MRAIEIVMLVVQVAILLVASWTIVVRKPVIGRRGPIWSSLALSLLVVSMASWSIADKHAGDAGSQILMYGSPLILGFAIAMLLMALRERRFGDAG